MEKRRSKLKAEIRAQWRRRAAEEMRKRGTPLPEGFRVSEPADGDLAPPDARRVAQRAGCLAAVALRGLAGTWKHAEQIKFLPRLVNWVDASPILFEIEAEELEIIKAPASELDDQSMVNACWRWEGAAVLNAALGRMQLPAHDFPVDTKACGDAAGLFVAADTLRTQLDSAEFAPMFDRFAYANQALAINWRLRQFVHADPEQIDFATFARGVEWAEFNLAGVRLDDGDLSIRGSPIAQADADLVRGVMSIATERHLAANWLIGWSDVYSEVETPT